MTNQRDKVEEMGYPERVLIVQYRDSNLWHGQVGKERFIVAVLTAVGFVIEDDENSTVLAQELIGDEYRNVLTIPRECILTKTEFYPNLKPKVINEKNKNNQSKK